MTPKRVLKPMDVVYRLIDRADADKHLFRPSSEPVGFLEEVIIMGVKRRAFEQQYPKTPWMHHESVEGDASSVRGATKPSLRRVGVDAILTIYERHYLIQQELG